jgi:protein-S-isoprenylcysteine O-methyltransferase Ste14
MTVDLNLWPTIAFACVMLAWFAFVAVFLLRKKPEAASESKRDRESVIGVALQGLAYAIVWSLHRQFFIPIFPVNEVLEIILAVLTLVIAFGSVWIVMSAVRTLGKEWSVTARLVEGHRLATTGPYRFIRHPIYTGMLGMLLATGSAISHWASLLIATVVFFAGTIIRMRVEERLLRGEFGQEFDDYRNRVAALIPGIF